MVAGLPASPALRQLMELAIIEVRQLKHPYIGTEHLVLGLLLLDSEAHSSIGRDLLIQNGLAAPKVKAEILKILTQS
jgi:ATP-dependent Clp protease ATP-binding subunit ClpC